jgi:membrane-bound serine protease (ClpP class)
MTPIALRRWVVLALACLPGAWVWGKEPPRVLLIRLEDQIIQPVTARFVTRALRQAEDMNARCLIIELDTPGGLLESTRRIVKDILQAEVPVVVYVAPRGARAGSAGVFITLAAHVAVMAPGTNIGAAHPVSLGGEPEPLPWAGREENKNKGERGPLMEKLTNDTVAWARSLASERHHNADWAARAVKESISAPAEEALAEKVIDCIASDETDLLRRLDGRQIALARRNVVLLTDGAVIEREEMSFSERVLSALANPNLAYLLLLVGFSGLLFEITHPGSWIPGILGLVCLALAFFALQMLPINQAGLALVVLGLLLLLLEVKVHSLGFLALAGLICLLLGSFMLIEPNHGVERVSWVVMVPASTATALILLFLAGNVVRAHQAPVRTGKEALLGAVGVCRSGIPPFGQGWVFVQGELWKAHSDQRLDTGDRVRVVRCLGLTLEVEPDEETVS